MKVAIPFCITSVLLSTSAIAQQQPTTPANFNIRVSAALRNDLAGLFIKMGQLAGCDVQCYITLSRALIALDAASPVPEPAEDKK